MIPKSLLKEILNDPFYKFCIRRKEGTCKGRVTLEHTLIYAGKQIQEKWAIVPLCEYHHDVCKYQDSGDLNKEYGQFISLQRVTDKELALYSKKDWEQLKLYLYGKYRNRNTK